MKEVVPTQIGKQPKSFLTNGIRKLVELHRDCVEK